MPACFTTRAHFSSSARMKDANASGLLDCALTPALSGALAVEAGFEVKRGNPPGIWSAPRLTQVVEVQGARLIFLSGQTAADEHYKVRSLDIREQTHAVYDNIERALAYAGATLRDVVKVTTYLTSADYIAPSREVRAERYRGLPAPPASTLLVVSRLAEPEFLIEMDVVAAVPAR
jgi:enamine deaminase RidA (YjgF/YER057c/UK114 family)